MAQKAVLVTAENREQLNSRFFQEGTGVPMAIGYYLVSGFGDHLGYELLNSANFNAKYDQGETFRNGFFEAIPKVVT